MDVHIGCPHWGPAAFQCVVSVRVVFCFLANLLLIGSPLTAQPDISTWHIELLFYLPSLAPSVRHSQWTCLPGYQRPREKQWTSIRFREPRAFAVSVCDQVVAFFVAANATKFNYSEFASVTYKTYDADGIWRVTSAKSGRALIMVKRNILRYALRYSSCVQWNHATVKPSQNLGVNIMLLHCQHWRMLSMVLQPRTSTRARGFVSLLIRTRFRAKEGPQEATPRSNILSRNCVRASVF